MAPEFILGDHIIIIIDAVVSHGLEGSQFVGDHHSVRDSTTLDVATIIYYYKSIASMTLCHTRPMKARFRSSDMYWYLITAV